MQYYKNYIDLKENIENIINFDIEKKDIIYYGKLDYDIELENYYCNNQIIINNRALYNDIVFIKYNDENLLEVINIKERNNKKITGILYLDSKIKYGSIKDKQLYLFKPTNKKYPKFYVPYKSVNNQKKIY